MQTEKQISKTRVVAVVGPTASGKTALAVALCRRFHGEVISFDSMQVYRGMPIGTAQPTSEETDGIPHHLIGFLDPEQPFSCADYVKLARKTVAEVTERGHLPVLCGGTGLYLDSLLRGGSFEETETDPAYREELIQIAESRGAEALHAMLSRIDPECARTVHPNNIKRVIRALEIYHTTGKTKSEVDRASMEKQTEYDALRIGIRYENRELLYRRIEQRVDRMLEDGLPEEARRLYDGGVFRANATAAQAIGYKELFGWIEGRETLEQAGEILKQATRRYAKRQMTWFGANPEVRWIRADGETGVRPFAEIVQQAEETVRDWLTERGSII